MKTKYHINISFKHYDFWIGIFLDYSNDALYICLLPMLPIKIWRTEHKECPMCDALMTPTAYMDDGWLLDWECYECGHNTEGEYEWPFDSERKSAKDLEDLGFKII